MSTSTIIYIVILGASAFASGFFSGSETALIAVSQERVQQLAGQGRRGQRVQQLVADPDRLLSTILVANNLVNILGAAVATTLFISLLGEQWGPWVATAVVTAVVLIVGEITPKSLAARYPERFSLAVAPTVWQLSRFLRPIANLFAGITRLLFRLFRIPVEARVNPVTEEDIRTLARLGLEEGEIEAMEHEIIDALFDLGDRPVREVMTPRIDIATLTLPMTTQDVRRIVADTGHSRYPVTTGELDDLRGVLYVKDVFQQRRELDGEEAQRLLRTPHLVPESRAILEVLQDMRARRFAFAMVVDEHGGIEGLVTIKDLVSELVGELQDEYDPGTPTVVEISPGQWLADGRLPLEDLEEALVCEFPQGPYSTAGGLFLAIAGRIPAEGDHVTTDGFRLTVLEMDRNRIDRLRVELA